MFQTVKSIKVRKSGGGHSVGGVVTWGGGGFFVCTVDGGREGLCIVVSIMFLYYCVHMSVVFVLLSVFCVCYCLNGGMTVSLSMFFAINN